MLVNEKVAKHFGTFSLSIAWADSEFEEVKE